jgi:quercetin dioxygenase-like cupin family protein
MNLAEFTAEHDGHFEVDPQIEHHFSDGLYAKRMVIPKGFEVGQHAHKFSHLSILAKGHVLVRTDDNQKEYTAPACIEIVAGVHHAIEALENSEWFCIHATDEKDIENIDQVLIERN